MPNHIKNKLELIGKESDVIQVLTDLKTENEELGLRHIDFNKIIPMPKELNIDKSSVGELSQALLFKTGGALFLGMEEIRKRFISLSEERRKEDVEKGLVYQKNLEKHGHSTWYGWACENWGTKWNAYSTEQIDEKTIMFDTAWSGVPGIILKLSEKYRNVKFQYKYSDEDTGCNCGLGFFENGEHNFQRLDNSSDEAYQLAFELRPDYKKYYHKVDGKWEYKDEEE